ncbi:hypothetical protein NM688_g5941 [Phlebia brevispora]|uniref:Uncharacterized protein n=1 Tax=Phlebia brevispora TaxID=194682 RepID=A0ACC1SMD9_9APHY|nr:hypothetical protein NM688_g5941 [Phlebia brevispora]
MSHPMSNGGQVVLSSRSVEKPCGHPLYVGMHPKELRRQSERLVTSVPASSTAVPVAVGYIGVHPNLLPLSRAVESEIALDDPPTGAFIGKPPPTLSRRAVSPPPIKRAFIGKPPPNARVGLTPEPGEREESPLTGIIGLPLPKTKAIPVKEDFYEPLNDEVEEGEQIHIPGETITTDTTSEGSDREVPVRVLTEFVIYQRRTKRIVPLPSLFAVDSDSLVSLDYGASGEALAWAEDDSDSDSTHSETSFGADGSVNLALSTIIETSIHDVEDARPKHFSLDSKIYIRTHFAWYILYVPSTVYYGYFAPLWIKARLFHEVVTSVWEDRRLSYEDFINTLPESDASEAADDVLGRGLTKADFDTEDTVAYITSAFEDLCAQEDTAFLSVLKQTKLFRTIMESSIVTAPSLSPLQDQERTVVTPFIHKLAKQVFSPDQLEVVPSASSSSLLPDPILPVRPQEHPCHDGPIQTMDWVTDSQCGPHHYCAVVLDNVRYDAGECIMMKSGEDESKRRRQNAAAKHSRSSNPLANTMWFAKICYFFEEEDGTKMVHVQWFQHGAQILLQELAHPHGLFLINECQDLPLDVIYQKANVTEIHAVDEEPAETSEALGYFNNFFTGVYWNQRECGFFDYSKQDVSDALKLCPPGQSCISCGLKELHTSRETWFLDSLDGIKTLSFGNTKYHIGDFIYIRSKETTGIHLYVIGQIEDITCSSKGQLLVDARLYQQAYQHQSSYAIHKSDERILYCTQKTWFNLDVHSIEGKAFALPVNSKLLKMPLDQWLSYEDHFYFKTASLASPLKHSASKPCLQHSKLQGLELFAGAGGLSAGLEQAGFVQTRWAVEWMPSPASTFKANHPHATVYNQSSNACLKHAILTLEGRSPTSLYSCGQKSVKLPPLPRPGDVDIIYGDVFFRNTLVANMMSYVDFYRPKFFLLENVQGLFEWKGHAALAHDSLETDIDMAAPKFIIRAMISLGYQIHFHLLNAGQYGAPQGRSRVIFLAAKRGVPLPHFPIPTHGIPREVPKYKLPTGDVLYPVVRHHMHSADLSDREVHFQYAPHHFVTVCDAICDLPQFDWLDPHEIYPQTVENRKVAKQRRQQGILSFSATAESASSHCGFCEMAAYPLMPQNRYQHSLLVERTVNVPLRPFANHQDLPLLLKLSEKLQRKKAYDTLFCRIDGMGMFRTALAQMAPNNKGGVLLHPTQKRIITVRECARAQGFPDHWKFLSEKQKANAIALDQYRQIGNAVPVPLAFALGKEIQKAAIQMWKNQEEREAEQGQSPEISMDVDD